MQSPEAQLQEPRIENVSNPGRAIVRRPACRHCRTLSGFRSFLGASADVRCGPGCRGHARGVPCSGQARAQTAEEDRARGLALPRHSRRLPEAQAKARRPIRAALAVDFPPAAPPCRRTRTLWARLAPQIRSRAGTMRTKQRNALLLVRILNHDSASRPKSSARGERRVEKRVGRGMRNWRGTGETPRAGGSRCAGFGVASEGCAATAPERTVPPTFAGDGSELGQRPSLKAGASHVERSAWLRWRRRFVMGMATVGVLVHNPGGIRGVHIDSFSGSAGCARRPSSGRCASGAGEWRIGRGPLADQRSDATIGRQQRSQRTRSLPHDNVWHAISSFTREQWKAA